MLNAMQRLVVEEEGADATEYALLAALIAVALIVGAAFMGNQINDLFTDLGDKLQDNGVPA